MKFELQDKTTQRQQNEINNLLALEYKTADAWRRHEILTEYYEANKAFVTIWRKWDHEHWAELTQNFATHWHRAFMEYTPRNEHSVFNLYMHRKFKNWASEDYKDYLAKTSKWGGLEDGGDWKEDKHVRKELYIHPTSDTDKRLLKWSLERSLDLDDGEQTILDHYFFGDMKQSEVSLKFFKQGGLRKPARPQPNKSATVACQCYEYQSKLRRLLNKMALCIRPEDLR